MRRANVCPLCDEFKRADQLICARCWRDLPHTHRERIVEAQGVTEAGPKTASEARRIVARKNAARRAGAQEGTKE